MAIECLSTKLYVPSVRPDLMPRPRLFDRLVPTTDNRLVLVSAPSGYWDNHPQQVYLLILSVGVLNIRKEGDAYDPRHIRYRYWHRCR